MRVIMPDGAGWCRNQAKPIVLISTDLAILTTVRQHMIDAGWHESALTPEWVLSAALDMAAAYIDIANQRMEVVDGH